MLHIIYRYWAGESSKPSLVRPNWFSKEMCLRRFLIDRATTKETTLTFLADGPLSQTTEALLRDHEGAAGVVILREHDLGNVGSCLRSFDIAASFPNDDIFYFVEDDYLPRPGTLQSIIDVLCDINVSYATPYDHPDRYTRHDDWPIVRDCVVWARSHHWRPIECTTMTFAGHVDLLKKDRDIFCRHVHPSDMYPQDRAFWREVQGLTGASVSYQRRVLYSAIPGLATHAETPYLSPGVDWEAVAWKVCQ